jgi:glutamine amidotransferase/cyclase
MLEVLRQASERVFVPLTVGGGIRGFSADGKSYSALEVASEYFRSGADKISIGSDAVEVAERYIATGHAEGTSSIEQISEVYGKQAVVVSLDPRRVYVSHPSQVNECCHLQVYSKSQILICVVDLDHGGRGIAHQGRDMVAEGWLIRAETCH